MKPVTQTIVDADQGDCFSAAVASLFELSLADVPHFTAQEDWWEAFRAWCHQRGLEPYSLPVRDGDASWHRGWGIGGVESTFPGRGHAVVVRDGKVVHCPANHPQSFKRPLLDITVFGVLDPADTQAESKEPKAEALNPHSIQPGDKVRYHPIIGGKHDGNVYVVRAANSNALWLYGKAGMVAWDAVTPVEPKEVA